MRSTFAFAFALVATLAAACSSSSTSSGTPDGGGTAGHNHTGCTLPQGFLCCDGDVGGDYSCSGATVVCDPGLHLTPSAQCVAPGPLDAGHDANACAPPTGYDCCDGDVEGTWTCDADGGTLCSQGTHLTPTDQCTIAGPLDAGPDSSGDAASD